MDLDQTFSAGQVAAITGISPNTQLDWRKRGILPAYDGKHSRTSLRDVCWLRLVKEFIDAGFPVGTPVNYGDDLRRLANEFLDSMLSMMKTVDRRETFDAMLAVVTRRADGSFTYEMTFDPHNTIFLRSADGSATFRSAFIINLADVAADMAAVMRELIKD